ncbi:MAG: hypothetical protein LC795_04695 [Acidobacteria bacterium]|nr:hypothetical protein [Acidobacteriota bacterium]MCA1618607.1 hypothetical protein [Acidobacteriota bacterium]
MIETKHHEVKTTQPLKYDERDGRTPARKLVKDDISSTSVLIRGCTTQKCCDEQTILDGV